MSPENIGKWAAEHIPSWIPFIGFAVQGKSPKYTYLLERFVLMVVAGIVASYLTVIRTEMTVMNHLDNNDVHMTYKEKADLFVPRNELMPILMRIEKMVEKNNDNNK
jgi:hypothetical protein